MGGMRGWADGRPGVCDRAWAAVWLCLTEVVVSARCRADRQCWVANQRGFGMHFRCNTAGGLAGG